MGERKAFRERSRKKAHLELRFREFFEIGRSFEPRPRQTLSRSGVKLQRMQVVRLDRRMVRDTARTLRRHRSGFTRNAFYNSFRTSMSGPRLAPGTVTRRSAGHQGETSLASESPSLRLTVADVNGGIARGISKWLKVKRIEILRSCDHSGATRTRCMSNRMHETRVRRGIY